MKFKWLVLSGMSLMFASCSHVYTPALYRRDVVYQPKPSSFDSVKAATYISAALNLAPFVNHNDQQESAQINVSRGYVFNHVNLAYGAFGVWGDYENGAIANGGVNYFTSKYYGAVGARASANLFSPSRSERLEYRYLGFEAAYSHEFGTYAGFRQFLNGQPGYFVDPRTNLFTIGLTTEILTRTEDKKVQQGFRLFLGSTLGYDQLINNNNKMVPNIYPQFFDLGFLNLYPKFSYYIKVKNYFGTAEIGGGIFIRFGRLF